MTKLINFNSVYVLRKMIYRNLNELKISESLK
jgi:hypothetical protein